VVGGQITERIKEDDARMIIIKEVAAFGEKEKKNSLGIFCIVQQGLFFHLRTRLIDMMDDIFFIW
jgi:hypothetical protein